MKIIVGLGNPGSKYSRTRHNLGFMLIESLALENSFQNKHKSQVQKIEWEKEKLLLVKPQTFMNLSGQAVKEIINFYKVPLQNLLVIQDDKDLPFGKIKFQKSRGHGGHNGVKNIHQELNSNAYTRLKMGIGREHSLPDKCSPSEEDIKQDLKKQDSFIKPSRLKEALTKDNKLQKEVITKASLLLTSPLNKLKKIDIEYVLSPFNKKEQDRLPDFLEKGVKAVFCFVQKGYETSANQFN